MPIVPSPGSCPCYLVSPNGTESSSVPPSPPQLPPNIPPNAVIGYIPVVFYPYCPGNSTNAQEVQPMFPSAVTVPYQCSQCDASSSPSVFYRRQSRGDHKYTLDSVLPFEYGAKINPKIRVRKVVNKRLLN